MNQIFYPAGFTEHSKLAASAREGVFPCSVFGVCQAAKPHLLAALQRPLLFVTHSQKSAEDFAAAYRVFSGEACVTLPAKRVLPGAAPTEDEPERVAALFALREARAAAVSLDALATPLIPPEDLYARALHIDYATRMQPAELARRLTEAGYVNSPVLESAGQFSVRGGIADVYLFGQGPVRIEFFDDEIDSLRSIHPETHRSLERLSSITIYPATTLLAGRETFSAAKGRLHAAYAEQKKRLKGEAAAACEEKFLPLIDSLGEGTVFPEELLPYFYTGTLLDYFPQTELVALDEPRLCESLIEVAASEYAELFGLMLAAGSVLPAHAEVIADYPSLLARLLKRPLLSVQAMASAVMDFNPKAVFTFATRNMQSFFANPNLLSQELVAQKARKSTVILCAQSETRARKLRGDLELLNVYCDMGDTEVPPGTQRILASPLAYGFAYAESDFLVIGHADIFHREEKKPRPTRKKTNVMQAFTELSPGDYAVHDTAGICVYRGLTQIEVSGRPMDFISLEFGEGDKLYVPVEQMDKVAKYIGGEGAAPRLHKLGGAQWAAAKARARRAIEDMTEELIALYRERENIKGYSFAPDTPFQAQFEEDFPYEETPDQLACVAAIKKDMESGKVMDRLLCGDVGYGKTEVALRAAFKAVMDAKQVALLAPTTILAQQHFNTIKNRFSGYSVTVDSLSRFRPPKEQKRILAELKAGNLDIIVGTHRLLGKDVKFDDLGLLIVDEEQRFGVAHKEKIKALKTNIDVLSLSATPIPRTLNMSFAGIRDMSVIETPPQNRFPVQTFVQEYNEAMLADAVRREIARGGQVFFVQNRIEGLESAAARIQELVPGARVAVGHGQMQPAQLEGVMLDFYNGRFDVLVSTSIVENGLDIPRANTIIVNNANYFGLSQLYQLRGRVGRGSRMAYAYFFYKKNRELTEIAFKRLDAIRDFTAFGSGFRIAMRDLELRGAGNLLGREQSGHMASIGYEMYSRMVREAVREKKGEAAPELPETTMDLRLPALLPADYITSEAQRLALYKRIAVIESKEEAEDVLDELIDRFGDPPSEAARLIEIALLRALLRKAGVQSLTESEDAFLAAFYPMEKEALPRLLGAVSASSEKCHLSAGDKIVLSFPKKGKGAAAVLAGVGRFFKDFMNKT